MGGKWGLGLVLLLAAALVLPAVGGQAVTVYTIPDEISVNSSFLLVAVVPGDLVNARVSWVMIGLVDNGALGSLEKLAGDNWVCDFDRTCGPNPFPVAGVFDANVYVTSNEGVIVEPHTITVTDLKVDPHLYPSDNDVLVQVYVPGSSAVLKYSLYNADTLEPVQVGGVVQEDKSLDYCDCPAGFYDTTIPLPSGKYYISFDAVTTDSRTGGSMKYFTMGQELQPLSLSLDSTEYVLGQRVRISGTTLFSMAGGEVRRSGVLEEEITLPLFSRGDYSEFSYDYLPEKTGSYELTVVAGLGNDSATKKASFSVSKLLDIYIPEIQIEQAGSAEREFTVTNLKTETLNISVSPDSKLEDFVTASLDRSWLGPGESATLTLSITSPPSSVQGSVIFRTGVAEIEEPVRIVVLMPLDNRPRLGVEPLVWSPEEGYEMGEVSRTFTITNKGTGTLGGFEYSLEGIDQDIVLVSLPGGLGMPPDKGEMVVSINPIYTGNERGTLRLTSNGGSQEVLIDLEFFPDISTDVDDLEWEMQSVLAELTGRGVEVPYTVSELATELANIKADLSNEYYASANRDFEKASQKWEGIASMVALVPAGGDMTLVLVFIAVVIAGAGGYLFLKKRKAGVKTEKKEQEAEEEDLEEFY